MCFNQQDALQVCGGVKLQETSKHHIKLQLRQGRLSACGAQVQKSRCSPPARWTGLEEALRGTRSP